jgi:TPR repeat protein
MKNASAENSFSICMERGIGVHKNLFLAAQYYQRAAQQGHLDGANDFGFCLEHGRGVRQNIEMAAEYYKFASDHGHLEAKLNCDRCLHLLGSWEPPDRSSDFVSHPPSVDFLRKLFGDFLDNPEPLDDDRRQLLHSFDRLRTPTEIPVISPSLKVEWILDFG